MKNLFLKTFSIVVFTLIFSCSNEEVLESVNNPVLSNPVSTTDSSYSQRNNGKTVIDTAFVVSESRMAMANFVYEIKEYYVQGMSYNEMKYALDPDTSLANITDAGNNLLQEAYFYIINDVAEEDMNGAKIIKALQTIVEYNIDNGIENVENVDFETGSQWLFGLNENSQSVLAAKVRNCKWYQIGCHLSNLWNWLTSPANGNGGATNAQVLGGIVSVLSGIFVILNNMP